MESFARIRARGCTPAQSPGRLSDTNPSHAQDDVRRGSRRKGGGTGRPAGSV